MWFPRLEMRCPPARSLVVWGDQKAFAARPLTTCAESAFFAAGDGLVPLERWWVSGPPRLVSGAPAYPGAELWARP